MDENTQHWVQKGAKESLLCSIVRCFPSSSHITGSTENEQIEAGLWVLPGSLSEWLTIQELPEE
jgi:hypothetical protein